MYNAQLNWEKCSLHSSENLMENPDNVMYAQLVIC